MKNKLLVGLIISIIITLGSLAATVLVLSKSLSSDTKAVDTSQDLPVDTSVFQAVFLNSGQTYFGKLTRQDSETFKLTTVYYLKDDTSLTRLGNEIHRPQDAIYIPVASVQFWENLQDGAFSSQLK